MLHLQNLAFNCLKSTYSRKKYISRLLVTNVLGIETSCDDTGCAIVNSDGQILGESLYSQNKFHVKCGGINPLIARELHVNNIELAVHEALHKASLSESNIDAIAVTVKPGLLVSLQVGYKYAKYLSEKIQRPIIPIHHMEAHALTARLYFDIPFPYVVLLISGGDCILAVAQNVDEFLLLGKTLDNAPGEVMDKAARRMKLRNLPVYSELSGGQAIEKAASTSKNSVRFSFPLPLLRHRDCNFSFSGLKDSFMRELLKKEMEHKIMGDGIIPEVNDICAAFQHAITKHLLYRTKRALTFCDTCNLISTSNKNIVVSGGVACNNFIFSALQDLGTQNGYKVYRPPPQLCTDNGVMVAWNGIEKLKAQCNIPTKVSLQDIEPTAAFGRDIRNEVVKANLPVKLKPSIV